MKHKIDTIAEVIREKLMKISAIFTTVLGLALAIPAFAQEAAQPAGPLTKHSERPMD